MPEDIIISDFSPDAPRFRVTREGDYIIIRDYSTNAPRFKINGEIGAGVKSMTTAERTAITPDAGALIYDTDEGVLYVGDGVTPGGYALSGAGGGDYIGGRWIDITSGTTISEAAYEDIETVDVSGASPSVTMVPGHAYSINATAKPVTLNTEVFAATKFGKESHLQIFVAGTGYVVTGANVYLKEPLEPDSINNCTVHFHGGSATISIEDHIGGYIVIDGGTAGSGTLNYGLASAGSSYIAFNDTLAGLTIDMGGVVTNGEKHVVGNGYADTIVTGGVSCTSKTTFANLSMQDAAVLGGTMTLGDVFIPSGSTVSVSGGGNLAIEKVTGNGGVIDLGGTHIVTLTTSVSISGLVFSGGSDTYGGAIRTSAGTVTNRGRVDIASCFFTSNTAVVGAAVRGYGFNDVYISGCTFTSNTVKDGTGATGVVVANYGAGVRLSSCTISSNSLKENVACSFAYNSSFMEFRDCTIEGRIRCEDNSNNATSAVFGGTNHFLNCYLNIPTGYSFVTKIENGAIMDFTGNAGDSSGVVINPGAGGGVIVSIGCTIINSAGASVSITGGTYAQINSDGTTEPPQE